MNKRKDQVEKRRITVIVPVELEEALHAHSRKFHRSASKIIREAIAVFINYKSDPNSFKYEEKENRTNADKAFRIHFRGETLSMSELARRLSIPHASHIANYAKRGKLPELFANFQKRVSPRLTLDEIEDLANQLRILYFDRLLK